LRQKPLSISLFIILLITPLTIQSIPQHQQLQTIITQVSQNYTHDIGCTAINSPYSTYATTLPVRTTIHNFGQTTETNFTTTTTIAALQTNTTTPLKHQNFSTPTFPPTTWTSTHSNWDYSNTSHAGGTTGEAKLNPTPHIQATIRFYTTINTSNTTVLEIQFNHRLYHFYYYYYECAVEVSKDGINWAPLWIYDPYDTTENPTITLYTTYLNSTNSTYISWTFDGDTSHIDAWYLDNITFSDIAAQQIPEYTDTITISSLASNTSKTVNFTNWDPQFPANQPNIQIPYLVTSWTSLLNPPDENPQNDMQNKAIILQYLHDVRIAEFILSSTGHKTNHPNSTPPPIIYIQPGTYPIQVRVDNQGTYSEHNLTCYYELWEFNNSNWTVLLDSFISNITLQPLGGEQILDLGTFTFENETIYAILADIPLANDYHPRNNDDSTGIRVDNTPPVSEHQLDPAQPNGENGWYTKEISMDLTANDYDPYYYGSGVDYLQYRIDKGLWITTYNGATIDILQDSPALLIEYRAIDMVGNIEDPNNFTIKMDHTPPKPVDALWESERKGLNWYINFQIHGEDNISGMSHCDMYINNGLYETTSGLGPWYIFTLQWSPAFKNLTFTFKAYNQAGLYEEDYLEGMMTHPLSYSHHFIYAKSHLV